VDDGDGEAALEIGFVEGEEVGVHAGGEGDAAEVGEDGGEVSQGFGDEAVFVFAAVGPGFGEGPVREGDGAGHGVAVDVFDVGDGYASKARPVVVVQSDAESAFDSVVLCLLTTFESSRIATRVAITPDETNGLKKPSFVMTEKLVTVDKRALGEKIGVLTGEQMRRIARQLARVLAIRKEDIDD